MEAISSLSLVISLARSALASLTLLATLLAPRLKLLVHIVFEIGSLGGGGAHGDLPDGLLCPRQRDRDGKVPPNGKLKKPASRNDAGFLI